MLSDMTASSSEGTELKAEAQCYRASDRYEVTDANDAGDWEGFV